MKIGKEKLDRIDALLNQVEMTRLKFESMSGALRVEIAEALLSVGGSLKSDSLCMNCGSAYPTEKGTCPSC